MLTRSHIGGAWLSGTAGTGGHRRGEERGSVRDGDASRVDAVRLRDSEKPLANLGERAGTFRNGARFQKRAGRGGGGGDDGGLARAGRVGDEGGDELAGTRAFGPLFVRVRVCGSAEEHTSQPLRVRDRAQARRGLLERARGLRRERAGARARTRARVGGRRRRAAAAGERGGARRRVLRVHQPERVRARAERQARLFFRGVEVSFDVARDECVHRRRHRARRLEKKQRAEGEARLGGEPQGGQLRERVRKSFFFRDAREAVRERARRHVSRDGGRERVRQRRATRAQRVRRGARRVGVNLAVPLALDLRHLAQQQGERSQTALGALGERAEARPGFRGGGGGDALGTERSQRERLTFCVLVHSNWFNLVWLRDKRFGIRSARAERDEPPRLEVLPPREQAGLRLRRRARQREG